MENKTIYMKSVQYNLSKNFIHRIVWQYLNAVLGFSCIINSFSVPVKQKNAYHNTLKYHNTTILEIPQQMTFYLILKNVKKYGYKKLVEKYVTFFL